MQKATVFQVQFIGARSTRVTAVRNGISTQDASLPLTVMLLDSRADQFIAHIIVTF